jgi:hypothetical protein
MSDAVSSYSVEERIVQGDTVWVAIRARGAEWSWLTPAEAARVGRQWIERYGNCHDASLSENSDGRLRMIPVPPQRRNGALGNPTEVG